jgi:ABC-type multidrug transport system fused ATPase/permease subunit
VNPPSASPADSYTTRRDRAAAAAAALERRSWRFSLARLAAIAFGVAGLGWTLARAADPPAAALALAAGGFVTLFALALAHRRVLAALAREMALWRLQQEGLARLHRDFAALPSPTPPEKCAALPLARDLDLFGPNSLFRLLGTVRTPPGRETLARWLVEPAALAEVRARQGAMAELAPLLDLRQELALRALELAPDAPFAERFLAWAEAAPVLAARPGIVLAARLLTTAVPLLGAVVFLTALPVSLWLLLLVGNLAFGYTVARLTHPLFDRVEARQPELAAYAHALALLATAPHTAPRLAALHERLVATGADPARELWRLEGLVEKSELRRSGMHPLVQALTLWDVHVAVGMERWQARCGGAARGWLAALGEWEALAALAGLAHDEPEWALPDVDATAESFVAAALGHPLLPADRRVANDVTVGPAGTVLLVTGSNMSGKSTLLRSIGLAATLAQAGGPVCARALRLPPVVLGTSILVEDSLADGVSFFMAELGRLKQVVDLAGAGQAPTADPTAATAASRAAVSPAAAGPVLLYLLDEVLRGTNSVERRIAVHRVLDRLLASGALGAVSTHDLALAEIPELREHLVPVHFRETLHERPEGDAAGEPLMTFDYHLRPGLATTTNALQLLRLVGL